MSGQISIPTAFNVKYKRGEEPPKESSSMRRHLMKKAEVLSQRSDELLDFFKSADNTELDQDEKPGYVYIADAPASGYLGRSIDRLRGFYQFGRLQVAGHSNGRKRQAFLQRERDTTFYSYQESGDRYYGTHLESLVRNPDGTNEFGFSTNSV